MIVQTLDFLDPTARNAGELGNGFLEQLQSLRPTPLNAGESRDVPPGRAKLSTSTSATGSDTPKKTMGSFW